MEENTNNKTEVMRISQEFREWVDQIKKEFEKQRGFIPSDADISTNIKRQFKGQFIV